MRGAATLILTLLAATISAQATPDLDLMSGYSYVDSSMLKNREVTYVFKGRNAFVKYNPLSLVFGSSLLFYQKFISPQIMQGCAFDPSCSAFSKGCIREFGLLKGVALSTDRLTRCTRLSSIDFHPLLFNEQGKVNDPPAYYHLRSGK